MYEVIYADPPWSYATPMFTKEKVTHITDIYPTMTLEDIKKLPVQELAAENCMLFMWATSPLLDQAFEVGAAWGFKYTTVVFIWNKGRSNPGKYTWSQCEICLLFKKGKIPTPRGTKKVPQYVYSVRGRHSQKPDAVRRRIETMFPTQKKIELFARKTYPNWASWGNQCEGSIDWNNLKPFKVTKAVGEQRKFGFFV